VSNTPAEQALDLVASAHHATLATHSLDRPGYPFASLVAFALDQQRRPFLLLSKLALHTKNVLAEPRSSLLVAAPAATDPQAAARLTLLGLLRAAASDASLTHAYLTRHPQAKAYVAFDDFGWYRFEPESCYWVGGFGAIEWLPWPPRVAATG